MTILINNTIDYFLTSFKVIINKSAYTKSFKQMAKDADVLSIAGEGMEGYFTQIKDIS